MRDANQLLYMVYNNNSNKHVYVDIEEEEEEREEQPPPPPRAIPSPPSLPTTPPQRPSTAPPHTGLRQQQENGNLVPLFNDLMRAFMGQNQHRFGPNGFMPSRGRNGTASSLDPLLDTSYNVTLGNLTSAATSVTSLSASQYSMGSIYQLQESQLQLNTTCPLGEGHFGVVYQGVMSKPNEDWEKVLD